ncbi:DUF1330 domain-containing protein [Mycolicibacter sp. MYC123]|uniref:DUF1330 domain-containing protein n=1 Tax=[Mycobacterium] zoologicum TaxID=2872311 RepID=A0ABU5YEY4_9MYCO|nr:DUF1330 domain-containing protein [Mycolicibacter sp. MYC123]MEB3048602.1 DUF1330 domain-containing protein [Mycolicibacter sp. MYC123]
MDNALQPTDEQLAAIATLPADAPVVMVNLLWFKKPDGLQSYLRYAQEVVPLMQGAGATVRYAGFTHAVILGDGQHSRWDAIVVVEYPTPAAFSAMVTSDAYLQIYEYRAAAIDRGDLIATSTWPVR